jgi:hypothetical protein
MKEIITDEDVQKALDYLRTNAPKAAQARANKVYMEEYRKVVKADLIVRCVNMTILEKESYAYTHQNYKTHLEALKDAVYQDELNRWGMVAATSTIEAWRTYNANRRGEGKLQ